MGGCAHFLPLLHHLPEVAEQVVRIVRAGRGFGVVLHAEERQCLVAKAFQRLVVQVHVRQLNLVGIDRVGIDGKVVVVRRDLHLAGAQYCEPGGCRRDGRT